MRETQLPSSHLVVFLLFTSSQWKPTRPIKILHSLHLQTSKETLYVNQLLHRWWWWWAPRLKTPILSQGQKRPLNKPASPDSFQCKKSQYLTCGSSQRETPPRRADCRSVIGPCVWRAGRRLKCGGGMTGCGRGLDAGLIGGCHSRCRRHTFLSGHSTLLQVGEARLALRLIV